MYASVRTHYETLGLSPSSSKKEIKSKFYELSKKYHPDLNPSKEANTRFLEISSAYSVLIDDLKRRQYDQGVGNDFSMGRSGFKYHRKQTDINPDDWIQYKRTYQQPNRRAYASEQHTQQWTETRSTWREYQEEREKFRARKAQEYMNRAMQNSGKVTNKMLSRLGVMLLVLMIFPDIFM